MATTTATATATAESAGPLTGARTAAAALHPAALLTATVRAKPVATTGLLTCASRPYLAGTRIVGQRLAACLTALHVLSRCFAVT
jgi:hypothetical protein